MSYNMLHAFWIQKYWVDASTPVHAQLTTPMFPQQPRLQVDDIIFLLYANQIINCLGLSSV